MTRVTAIFAIAVYFTLYGEWLQRRVVRGERRKPLLCRRQNDMKLATDTKESMKRRKILQRVNGIQRMYDRKQDAFGANKLWR